MPTLPKGVNPNRIVAVLTPLVFAPLAGAIAAGVAKYGISVDDDQVQAIFIAGATIALAKSAQWTKGWQAFEQRQAAEADSIALGADDAFEDEVAEDETEAVAVDEPELPVADEPDEDLHGEADDDLGASEDMDDDLDEDADEDDMDDLDAEGASLVGAQGS